MPALVLLAAGESRRLGRPKALVRLRDESPASPLELLLADGACMDAAPPLVVAGAHAREIGKVLPPGAELATHPDWRAGRTGSVALAVRRRPGLDLCLAPVDVPAVGPAVFEALRSAWEAAGAPVRGWLAPFVRDENGAAQFGHPLVLGRGLLGDLVGGGTPYPPDRPLRELRSQAEPLLGCQVATPAILENLDTPADVAALAARLRRSDRGGRRSESPR